MTKEHKTYINYKMVTSVAAATLMSLGLVGLGGHSAKADVNTDSQKQVANTTVTDEKASLASDKNAEDTTQPVASESNNSENQNTTKENSNITSKNLISDTNSTTDNSTTDKDPLLPNEDISNGYTDKGFTYIDPTLTSPERQPSYHLNTNEGWSNDLQTIVYDKNNNEYDLYYLHTKGGAGNATGGQNWNRVTTKDFIHFSEPTDAIPERESTIGDAWQSAWTGSIITNKGNISGVPKGAKVAYFSGLSIKDNQQNIWAAWSDDNGKTFMHPLYNSYPVIDHYWGWTSKNRSDERDPSVFYWKNNKMIMYAAEGNDLGVYQSTDGLHWSKANPNNESKVYNDQYFRGHTFEPPVECPAVRSMKTSNGTVKQVLFMGSKSPQDGQTTGTYYIVGHLDDNGIFVPETNVKRLDQGSDYYGANFSGSDDLTQPDDSIISMGWVGNWNYTNSGVKTSQKDIQTTSRRIGSYTLARKLVLNNDLTISSTPIVDGLEKSNAQVVNGKVSDQVKSSNGYQVLNLKDQPANSRYELHFSTSDGENYKGLITIKFTQGLDNNEIIFDPTTGEYRVDGNSSELTNGAASYYNNGLWSSYGYKNDSGLKNQKDITFTIYTDKDSIELFFPNGQSYTMARFCVNNKQDLTVSSQDPDNNAEFTISSSEVGPELVGYVEKTTPEQPSTPSDSGNTDVTPSNPSTPDTTNPSDNKNNSDDLTKAVVKSLMHNALVYDENGSISDTPVILKAGSVLKTYGIKTIKGHKYYVLKGHRYIKVGNIAGTSRRLHHNAYIYNKHGKRIGRRVLRKGKKIRTYGARISIHGKKYYIIGKNKFVKVANF